MSSRRLSPGCLALVASMLAFVGPGEAQVASSNDQSAPLPGPTVDFAKDVRPILADRCVGCHGPDQRKGGLRLDLKSEAMLGGDSGPAFHPGDSVGSEILFRVTETDPTVAMPPEGEPLRPEEVAILQAWIDQGAVWPDDADEPRNAGSRSSHWAFRPVERPPVPAVRLDSWPRNPIDSFVLSKLEQKGISPAPEADRRTLIRRLSIDLNGLLPSVAEVEEFVRDDSEGAYERLVDRLLASPHYGERWGRHWLDLARYADSDGYEKDSPRPFAFRYRDWVIDALNDDMPFDQFTIEQLAGDLLPDPSLPQRTATGFHRNTLTNREGGADPEEFRVASVVDRVNTTGTVWLGLTIGCAQCHTHKYDPITQREYYGLYAFFNTSVEADQPFPLPGEQEAYEAARSAFEQELLTLKQRLTEYDSVDSEYLRLKAKIEEREQSPPKPPGSYAATLAEPPGDPRTTYVLSRGDFLRPGDEVMPGTPGVLPELNASPDGVPNRMDLARWLVSQDHPLTARVAVNRIWFHLFGRALVPTMDDFGTRGESPSHPELLDWLASEYRTRGWSQKAFIRLVVTSSTYRQDSSTRPELLDIDPYNALLARQNRFRPEAEVVRDLFLGASGLLSSRVGGPSVRPPQPPGIAELTYAGSAKWVESQGQDRYRRGLYTWFQRTSPYPMLTTFDSPDANVCAVGRDRSNTPLQALTLLNDEVFFECAQALGDRILREHSKAPIAERLAHAFTLCLGRPPDQAELTVLRQLHDRTRKQFRDHPEDARTLLDGDPPPPYTAEDAATWIILARTIMNLDEFVTRE